MLILFLATFFVKPRNMINIMGLTDAGHTVGHLTAG